MRESQGLKYAIYPWDSNLHTELDLSNVPSLTHFSCYSNQLSELDLTRVPRLVELNCEDNWLTELDLSNGAPQPSPNCLSCTRDNQLYRARPHKGAKPNRNNV